MFKKRSSSKAAIVGLDLDPGHIAAAEVTVTSATGNTFTITKTDQGVVTSDCTAAGKRFGCPTGDKW